MSYGPPCFRTWLRRNDCGDREQGPGQACYKAGLPKREIRLQQLRTAVVAGQTSDCRNLTLFEQPSVKQRCMTLPIAKTQKRVGRVSVLWTVLSSISSADLILSTHSLCLRSSVSVYMCRTTTHFGDLRAWTHRHNTLHAVSGDSTHTDCTLNAHSTIIA